MNEVADQVRAKVHALEAQMLAMPQVDLKVVHHFAHGVYARELHIPKGTVLTGAIHKYPNLNVMTQGELTVLTEDGPIRVKAPFTCVSPAGVKRAAYAHEDTIWTTIFGSDERDPQKIVDSLTTTSEQEFLAHRELCLLEKD